jgi:hypothetical protein
VCGFLRRVRYCIRNRQFCLSKSIKLRHFSRADVFPFEPYVVVSRMQINDGNRVHMTFHGDDDGDGDDDDVDFDGALPPFDERFYDRGLNKAEWTLRLSLRGWRYVVLPDVYVAHRFENATSFARASRAQMPRALSMLQKSIARELKSGGRTAAGDRRSAMLPPRSGVYLPAERMESWCVGNRCRGRYGWTPRPFAAVNGAPATSSRASIEQLTDAFR